MKLNFLGFIAFPWQTKKNQTVPTMLNFRASSERYLKILCLLNRLSARLSLA